jgi:hypothetical protein
VLVPVDFDGQIPVIVVVGGEDERTVGVLEDLVDRKE